MSRRGKPQADRGPDASGTPRSRRCVLALYQASQAVSLTCFGNVAPHSSAGPSGPRPPPRPCRSWRWPTSTPTSREMGFKTIMVPDRWRGRHFARMLELVAEQFREAGRARSGRPPCYSFRRVLDRGRALNANPRLRPRMYQRPTHSVPHYEQRGSQLSNDSSKRRAKSTDEAFGGCCGAPPAPIWLHPLGGPSLWSPRTRTVTGRRSAGARRPGRPGPRSRPADCIGTARRLMRDCIRLRKRNDGRAGVLQPFAKQVWRDLQDLRGFRAWSSMISPSTYARRCGRSRHCSIASLHPTLTSSMKSDWSARRHSRLEAGGQLSANCSKFRCNRSMALFLTSRM